MNFLLGLPLAEPVNGAIYAVIVVLSAIVVAWARKIVPVVLALFISVGAWYFLQHWDIPAHVFVASGICLAALLRKPKLSTTLAGIASLVAVVGLVNLEYQTYSTVGSLDPRPVAQTIPASELASHAGNSAGLVHLDLPSQGFKAREAIAYLPPAYWSGKRLPVLVLLHGNPGGPTQWFGSGEAAQTADEFQKANGGVSPIVVAVDATGSETANPVCADSQSTKVMTYLTKDVPAQIKKQLRVDEDQSHWTLGGLSYGGTCTLQVATNHPEAFGTYLDFSGEAEPTIGKHADTVQKFFGGNEQAFQAQNPAFLLKKNRYPGLSVVFFAGDKDKPAIAAQNRLAELVRGAGGKTYVGALSGGHSFGVWRPALRQSFAFAARRGGLTAVHDPFRGIEDNDVHA
ncbi:alpha/beta hydrolase [Corynebacterium simulans]